MVGQQQIRTIGGFFALDFNRDGQADIVLQNDSRLIVVDYTNGSAVIGRDVISNPRSGWRVEAGGNPGATWTGVTPDATSAGIA